MKFLVVGLALSLSATVLPSFAAAPAKPKHAELEIGGRKWVGDYDEMVKRRVIRVLVVHSKTQYFVDKGVPYGTAYESARAFEESINRKRGKGLRVHVFFVPTTRDQLIPALLDGRGDIAAAGLTVTPERLEKVDFAAPMARDVKEIVVTGPQSPSLARLEDLSGQEVFTRRSSSYWEHLEGVNRSFQATGLPPVRLRPASENLEDEDLLEMLNAGLVKVAVVDAYKAKLWAQILPKIVVHDEIAVYEGGEIGWMIRKGSPLLKAEVDAFARTHGQGTLFGNTVIRKYAGSTRFVKQAAAPAEVAKYERLVTLFRTYGDRYAVDYLLMMAQGYQESGLDQDAKSRVGAVGVMQIMPATGKELQVGDIRQVEPNIHGGVKYIRSLMDRYVAEPGVDDMNKMLFAFAAYNCGPARLTRIRRDAAKQGLDPNVWFQNVEAVAAAQIGAETVTYVSNIFKYYVAYKLLAEDEQERRKAREQVQGG